MISAIGGQGPQGVLRINALITSPILFCWVANIQRDCWEFSWRSHWLRAFLLCGWHQYGSSHRVPMNLSLTEVFPCPTGPVERGLDFHPRALQKTSPGAMLLFLRSQEILHNISSGKNSSAPYIYPLISFKWARKCPRLPIKTWGFVEATDGLPHRGLGKWIERQCGGHKFIPPTLFSASWV